MVAIWVARLLKRRFSNRICVRRDHRAYPENTFRSNLYETRPPRGGGWSRPGLCIQRMFTITRGRGRDRGGRMWVGRHRWRFFTCLCVFLFSGNFAESYSFSLISVNLGDLGEMCSVQVFVHLSLCFYFLGEFRWVVFIFFLLAFFAFREFGRFGENVQCAGFVSLVFVFLFSGEFRWNVFLCFCPHNRSPPKKIIIIIIIIIIIGVAGQPVRLLAVRDHANTWSQNDKQHKTWSFKEATPTLQLELFVAFVSQLHPEKSKWRGPAAKGVALKINFMFKPAETILVISKTTKKIYTFSA